MMADNVESALAEAKKALETSEAGAMNSAREKLTQASHKLAEAMYKSASQPGAQGGAAVSAPVAECSHRNAPCGSGERSP